MNIVDILIILFFITAMLRGVELGLVRQMCSTIGLLAGFFLGVLLQGKLINLVHSPATKALLSLVIIVAAIGIFSTAGEYIGVFIRTRIERARRVRLLDQADRVFGSVIAGTTLLIIVWLSASVFASAPMQGVQRQIRNSFIIAQLNKTLPPAPDVVAKLGHFIDPNSFPEVFTGLEPKIDTDAPLPSIGDLDAAVQQVRASVVKIEGNGCGGVSQGSGFVADKNLVVTNAHVIAGVATPYVLDAKGRHKTQVIWFDPDLDIAILKTNGLAGKALVITTEIVKSGTHGAVIGYPGGGDLAAHPATILDSFKAIGRDIYNQGTTERNVYSVKSAIEPGNSGGPVIDKGGVVIGLVFAESTAYDDVGYALTTDKVIESIESARSRSQTVATGSCAQ